MLQTVEVLINENGTVQLLEDVQITGTRHGILTILADAPKKEVRNQTLSEKWADKEALRKALNEAYADQDDDLEEKEFLRLAALKQFKSLDEWK